MDVMSDRPNSTSLSTIASINVPDTNDNNLEIVDADYEGTKDVDSKMLALTDTSSMLDKSSQMKPNA